jgi:hypothetical protein
MFSRSRSTFCCTLVRTVDKSECMQDERDVTIHRETADRRPDIQKGSFYFFIVLLRQQLHVLSATIGANRVC